MVCPACGTAFDGVGNFCPRCGAPVAFQGAPGTIPPAGYGYAAPGYGMPAYTGPAPTRVQRNLQLLSILWAGFAVYRLATGLMGIFALRAMTHGGFFGHRFPFDSDRMPHMASLLPFTIVTTLAFVGLTALVAYALKERMPRGRTLAITMSILSLVKFPLGTALGIYTLWVLSPAMSAVEYEMLVDRTKPGF